ALGGGAGGRASRSTQRLALRNESARPFFGAVSGRREVLQDGPGIDGSVGHRQRVARAPVLVRLQHERRQRRAVAKRRIGRQNTVGDQRRRRLGSEPRQREQRHLPRKQVGALRERE